MEATEEKLTEDMIEGLAYAMKKTVYKASFEQEVEKERTENLKLYGRPVDRVGFNHYLDSKTNEYFYVMNGKLVPDRKANQRIKDLINHEDSRVIYIENVESIEDILAMHGEKR